MHTVESRIGEWRGAILRNGAVTESDADELEGHLREQVVELEAAGLAGDEAFLIAVRRLGEIDEVTAEYAREHGDRLWKQLAVPSSHDDRRSGLVFMLWFAAIAGGLTLIATRIAISTNGEFTWLLRNSSLFVLVVLAAYFALTTRMPWRRIVPLAAAVAVLAVAVNVYPFDPDGGTMLLASLHLSVVLWFVVGVAYLGGDARPSARRMNFLRFSGEWVIYYTLIALGGAVLMTLTTLILSPIVPEVTSAVGTTVMPAGAAAAVVVAAWLVEAKKNIIENIVPVLTAIFTPLFLIMLGVSVIVYAGSGIWRDFNRELLTVLDVLLLVVLALVVYGISARDVVKRRRVMDAVRLCTVVPAVILDALVLFSMFERIGEYGFTANRVAALGLNLILLVNLVVTVWYLARLVAGKAPAEKLERWQTGYLPVFAVWAIFVVLALPPIFGFA